MGRRWSCATSQGRHGSQPAAYLLSTSGGPLTSCEKQRIAIRMVCSSAGRVTVHGQGERGTAIWRVSPPPTPPHNVADLSEFVMANSFAATLRGGGHLTPRERLRRTPTTYSRQFDEARARILAAEEQIAEIRQAVEVEMKADGL
jgi:hypothetical protein